MRTYTNVKVYNHSFLRFKQLSVVQCFLLVLFWIPCVIYPGFPWFSFQSAPCCQCTGFRVCFSSYLSSPPAPSQRLGACVLICLLWFFIDPGVFDVHVPCLVEIIFTLIMILSILVIYLSIFLARFAISAVCLLHGGINEVWEYWLVLLSLLLWTSCVCPWDIASVLLTYVYDAACT